MSGLPATIASLVDHWGRVAPDREAVRHGGRSWTWAQLGERVGRQAAGQRAMGLGPGDRVAYLDRNSPVHLETALACLRVGTVLTPVNVRLAPDEIRYVLDDAQAKVVLVGPEFVPVLASIRAHLPAVRRVLVVGGADDEYEHWLRSAEPFGTGPVRAREPAFLQLYTSGTTGRPKGAVLGDSAVTAAVTAVNSVIRVDRGSSGMVALPLFHIASLAFALQVMFHGGRTVLVREIDPPALLDELVAQRITHVPLVPAVYAALLRVPGVAERDYRHLEALVYGASPMPPSLLRRVLETFDAPVYQGYGMTEAASVVTVLGAAEHRDARHRHRLASAGTALPGVELAIVDPVTGERLGSGAVGEVWVRTPQLMTGYWRAPNLDTSAITPDGWLRTGDAGHLDDDGYLFIVDRVTDMIISGGENIYPAEVERVLDAHPDVGAVAVVGVPDERWGEVGVAFVVPSAGASVAEDALLRHCREHLAAFKCPTSVHVVPELPRNAAGKVLKRALRDTVPAR